MYAGAPPRRSIGVPCTCCPQDTTDGPSQQIVAAPYGVRCGASSVTWTKMLRASAAFLGAGCEPTPAGGWAGLRRLRPCPGIGCDSNLSNSTNGRRSCSQRNDTVYHVETRCNSAQHVAACRFAHLVLRNPTVKQHLRERQVRGAMPQAIVKEIAALPYAVYDERVRNHAAARLVMRIR